MNDWKPISFVELDDLLKSELEKMTEAEVAQTAALMVTPYLTPIKRSDMYGVEHVYVVANLPSGLVVYYDDVECGFEVSPLDAAGSIVRRGGR